VQRDDTPISVTGVWSLFPRSVVRGMRVATVCCRWRGGSETKIHRESGTTNEATHIFPLWCTDLSGGLKKQVESTSSDAHYHDKCRALRHIAYNADVHSRCAFGVVDVLLWRWAPSEHTSAGPCSHVDQICIECARVLSEATAIKSPLA
jgi:hypothetical protein